MGVAPHYWLDLVFAGVGVLSLALLHRWSSGRKSRRSIRIALAAALAAIVIFVLFSAVRIARQFPAPLVEWARCVGLFAAIGAPWAAFLTASYRWAAPHDPGRRRLLGMATAAAAAAPVAIATVGILKRDDLRFREVEIRVPSRFRDLHGLRIVQLTDIHLSSFVPRELLRRAVAAANEVRPHIALVTGDLISTRGDPLDECLSELAALRADAGILGCTGNHEIYAGAERYVEQAGARLGMRFLRGEAQSLVFGNAVLNLSGVDYQRRGSKYLDGAESLLRPDAFNVLLSHNPDVFPVAAAQGFDFTISGHTHGGQVTLELLHPTLNIVRFTTPYVYGLFEQDGRQMYVSRGIGTIGVPVRLGAPPEVVCFRLCAT